MGIGDLPFPSSPAPRRSAGLASLLALALANAACERVEEIREQHRPATPHEAYEAALIAAGLAGTALARDWSLAAERAIRDALPVEPPYHEVGYLPPEEPTAIGYRISARRGQRLIVEARLEPDSTALLFIDLFQLFEDATRTPRRVASADSGARRLEYEPRRDGEYVLRLQPELLRGGRFTVTVRGAAILAFPVAGGDADDVWSVFGDPRDGGARDHHGVDIFAPRGTPVLAAVDGVVTRVRETPLGGKVIWLRDELRGHSLYYAHLDTQLVAEGRRVRVGDTIGLVGNTGNARETLPHLHFGIYRRGAGPLDPYPFVDPREPAPPRIAIDTTLLGRWTRARSDGIRLRASPSEDAPRLDALPRFTAMRVVGGSGGWYRVVLPDGRSGYVAARLMEGADRPVRSEVLADARVVFDRPAPAAAVIERVNAGETVPVLGRFGEFLYILAPDGRTGWLPAL
jgi:murein DD-endopeptidase MepM/ murein hydrolase activator NlpD